MRNSVKILSFLFCACVVFLFASCTRVIGYSVVLWNIPEQQLADGTIVPVYVKSNIAHEYVIKNPVSGERAEVPLWKLSEPMSRAKTQKFAVRFEGYSHKYAKCILDGLPVRAEPSNTAKQVYRLRKDEILRTLYEGKGDIPTNGKELLAGKWLRVLTADGTFGWCFSQSLRSFEMNADGSYGEGAAEAQVQLADETLDAMLKKRWFPDYYAQMISRHTLDLTYVDPSYGFDTGSTTGTVQLTLHNLQLSYPYTGVTKIGDGVYKFNETPVQVTVRGNTSLVLQYMDNKGKRRSFNFITLDDDVDIEKLIAEEKERREGLYRSLVRLGPTFTSSNYGELSFLSSMNREQSFSWNDFGLLVPSVISSDARGSGGVEIKYFLPAKLKNDWDGILTFSFDGMDREVNFLYRQVDSGLRLAVATVTVIPDTVTGRNTISVSLPVNSLIIFFHN